MQTQTEMITEFAKLYVQESRLWEKARERDGFSDPAYIATVDILKHRRIDVMATYTQHYTDAHTVVFSGALREDAPEELTHYDIEDALAQRFGKDIEPDSESGMFSVNVTFDSAMWMKQYLLDEFPALGFGYKDIDSGDVTAPGIRNWPDAAAYCATRDIEVEDVECDFATKTKEEIVVTLNECLEILKTTGLDLNSGLAFHELINHWYGRAD